MTAGEIGGEVRRGDLGAAPAPGRTASWRVVAGQECRDLWVGGRAPVLLLALSVLLSIVTYLAASNEALNFLDHREAVNVALQIAVVVGVLVTLVASADAISGERDRGTLECLLLAPVSRRTIVVGKLAATLSLWFGTYLVSLPYIWVLGEGVAIVREALVLGLLVGTLLAVGLAVLGLLISAVSATNRMSLAVSLFLLIALVAPTQLPAGPQGWFGTVLDRVNPVGAAMDYVTTVLVQGHSWTSHLSYLVSPVLVAVFAAGALLAAGSRVVRLRPGVS
jgi:ABC-2 type transport system permease protein